MSENTRKTLEDANERMEHAQRGNRLVPLAAAIIAVLAALGTLFSHHRSISALAEKNQAILTQSRAADFYNRFESKSIRANIYQALVRAEVARSADTKKVLDDTATREQQSAFDYQMKARALEEESDAHDLRSERILRSYETLEIATTFFEVSIVLVSISALARTRVLLAAGSVLSAIGVVMLAFGYFQGH